VKIKLECDTCTALSGISSRLGSYGSFEEAKAAYDKHTAEKHPPDPRDVFVREIVELLDGIIDGPMPANTGYETVCAHDRVTNALRLVVGTIKAKAVAAGVKL